MLNRLPTPTQLPPLGMMLEDLGNPGPAEIGRALGVSKRQVSRWIAAGQAPRPAMLALWWVTRWGLSAVDAESVNLARLHAQRASTWQREANALRAELARVLAVGEFGCANDASLAAAPAQIRPPLRVLRAQA